MSTYTPPSPRPPAGAIFTFREGATTNPSHALYGSFAEALAAAQQVRPSTIWIDPSGGPGIVPAGTWNIDGIRIWGGDGTGATLVLASNAYFTGAALYFSNVSITPENTLLLVEDTDVVFLTMDQSSINGDSSGLVQIVNSASLFLALRYFSYLYTASDPVFLVDTNAQLLIFADIATSISDNCLDGDGSILINDLTGIAVDNRNTSLSHTQPATNITYTYG